MRGYDTIAGDHFYFATDAATALRYAEYWTSVGCDAVFIETEVLHGAVKRYNSVSYEDMRERVYYDEFLAGSLSAKF